MKHFFRNLHLILCLLFVACAPSGEKNQAPSAQSVSKVSLQKTRLAELPEDNQPHSYQIPKLIEGLASAQLASPPISVPLPRLLDENGKPILNSLGKPFYLGNGGLSQFRKYTTDDGLALDAVNCSIVDSRGHIWFGTNGNGISRFDGLEFTNYTITQGLAGNSIRSIFEDSKGNIWVGTVDNGVSKFDGKVFTNYGAEQLGNGIVFSIAEDRSGNLWFGTSGAGASRFDGSTFTNFTEDDGIGNNMVVSIQGDSEGNLWFGTYGGGLTKFDGEKFTNYTQEDGLASDRVRSVFIDKEGKLWLGTIGGGVSVFDGKNFQTLNSSDGLTGNVIRAIVEDLSGNIWIATENGVSRYDGSEFVSYTMEQGLADNNVLDISLDHSGKLWFSTDGGGVSILEGTSFTNYTTAQGLAGNIVLSILEDHQGTKWFGTAGDGVSRFDGNSFETYTSAQGLSGDLVFSMLEDERQRIWFGTSGDGISIFDGTGFLNLRKEDGLLSNEVYALKRDSNGNIWIGTDSGLSRFDGKTLTDFTKDQGLVGNDILGILEDQNGGIWIAALDGGLSRFDGESFINFTTSQGLADNEVLSIAEDQNGNLWVGTKHGLSFLDKKNVDLIASSPDDLPAEAFLSFTSQNGLADDMILQVVPISDQKIAIGTNQGITLFDAPIPGQTFTKLENIQIFNSNTGYPVKDLTDGQNGLFLDKKGILWAGTGSVKTALSRFEISKLSQNPKKPDLLVKQIRINEEIIPWHTLGDENSSSDLFTQTTDQLITLGRLLEPEQREALQQRFEGLTFDGVSGFFPIPQNLTLPYKHNHINIEFGSNELSRPFLVEYQYMLEGYDEDWSPILKKTSATFGNIQEGDYTFKVKARYTGPASVEAREWTEPISFTFTVLPPWYRSWWAYAIYTILGLSLLYPLHIYQRNQVIKAEQEKVKERELAHAKEIEKAYNELEKAHENLKSTQSQLIQAEKMASLGELTAGIAHEIQNPLNFVKNFSEVSHELLDEMSEEMDNGDLEEAKAIADDIKQNLDRITLHSKRADSIVKAMLQHSRTSSGEKEPTDINALAEEYIHLSYHGIRAKDKEFNADFGTNLDPKLPLVTVIPQEIGRILLNMFNNAFYAVNEKAKSGSAPSDYKPKVTVSTKKLPKGIEIVVADNGPGIPNEIVGKIFQPFFTTKPTGQGTGLGLSLSYDIVKSHGGELSVNTNTGSEQGTQFRIYLPI
ncbi:two-component regulator propeller domain-containing protein [Algoriphagus sp. CAU 1675]|uniref:sensor histidine kinase n=1 Tax=Algoriphagus sp. CAU 1675 TaxID=3032597 RepID=UPI0023DA1DA5|nr:two-component regulator propeller domain-containing protein [Algoriphagus sp. CAU 1675]MDF2156737.1 two-component regulator propeller domain-containing protein [Algoriphagus sp. CAU 1675]